MSEAHPADWSLHWIEDRNVRHTHLALAIPGGAAAEQRMSARPGISHLLEHVLYRQNDADGSPMDDFGGKYGLRTTRDLTTAYVAVPHAEARTAAALIRRWWDRPRVTPAIVEQETAIVSDEVRGSASSAGHVIRGHLYRHLSAGSYLDRDFAGRGEELDQVSAEELLAFYRAVHALPATLVAVGPECPWDDAPAAAATPWWPAASFVRGTRRILLQGSVSARAIVAGLAVVPGLASPDALQSFAGFAAIEYGQLHPAQRRFHHQYRLRFLNPTLEMSAEFGLFGVAAYCPPALVEPVIEIVEQLLRAPAEGSTDARLKRAAEFHLGRTLEDPRALAVTSAQHAAYGCDLPAGFHERVCRTDAGELARLVRQMEDAPIVIGALVPAVRRSE